MSSSGSRLFLAKITVSVTVRILLTRGYKTADHRTTCNRNISNLTQITDMPARNHVLAKYEL